MLDGAHLNSVWMLSNRLKKSLIAAIVYDLMRSLSTLRAKEALILLWRDIKFVC